VLCRASRFTSSHNFVKLWLLMTHTPARYCLHGEHRTYPTSPPNYSQPLIRGSVKGLSYLNSLLNFRRFQ
jgi:hypothetical protein